MRRRLSVGRSVPLIGFALLLFSSALSAASFTRPSLTATAASASQINLTWTDPNNNETGYEVERSLSSSSGFVAITTTGANGTSFANTGLASNTTYYYRVRPTGKGNSNSYSNVASARTLTATGSVPAAPSNLAAAGMSSSSISISWKDNSTNETAFKVERAPASGGPWAQLGTTAAAGWGDNGLPASTTYYYRVRAYNAYGNSAYSNTAFASTLAGTSLPAAPSSLSATSASASQINLAWADLSGNESGFKIERSTATSAWAQIGTVGTNVTSYASTSLSASTGYSYRVRAYNTAGDSGYSNTASATTLAATGGTGAFLWSTHFGGPAAGVDSAKPVGVVVDGTGASIVLGTFYGSVNFGGGSVASAGNGDVYLVKYSATGGHLWSKRFGGTQEDVAKGIAIDASGNVVITGYFGGTVDFGGGALTGTSANGFLAKYSSAGAHLWSKRLTTGSTLDEGTAVGVDGAGNLIVAAGFYNTVTINGGGSLTSAGAEDIALLKYNSAGGLLWSKRIGGASNDMVRGLAVDTTTGEFVTAGYFAGSVNFGGTTLASAGGNDAFVARYNSSGTHTWSRRWGSTAEDKAFGVDVDGVGNVAVTGMFTNNVDFGGGALTNVGGVLSGDIFLVKISSTGVYLWSKGFGSALETNQIGYGVAFDGAGNVLLTGFMVALTAPYTVDFGGGAFTGDGYTNTFIAKFGSAGSHTWSKRYLAGNGHAAGLAIAADGSNNVLGAGYYENSISFGGTIMSSPGGADTYLVKLGP